MVVSEGYTPRQELRIENVKIKQVRNFKRKLKKVLLKTETKMTLIL